MIQSKKVNNRQVDASEKYKGIKERTGLYQEGGEKDSKIT